MKSFLALLLVLLVVSAGVRARAAEVVATERPVQMHFDGGMGGSTFGVHAGGIFLLRGPALEAGPTLQCTYFFDSKCGVGAAAGLGLHGASPIGLDVLGEFGVNSYHISNGFLSGDPGVTDAVMYAGGRVGVNWSIGNRANRIRTTLGLWLYGQHDLEVRDITYTYTDSGTTLFGTPQTPEQKTVTHRMGGRDEVGLRFGVGFDLSPF